MRIHYAKLSAVTAPLLVRWLVVAGALALVSGLSGAATITLSQFPPDPGVLPGGGWEFKSGTTFAQPPPQRAWINGVYGGVPKIVATDAMTLAGRAGPLAVAAAQRVGIAEAAAAVARCLAGGGPVCGAVTAAAMLYEGYRIFRPADHAGSPACASAELCFDVGTDPVPVAEVCTPTMSAWQAAAHRACGPTIGAAAAAWVEAENALPQATAPDVQATVELTGCNASRCTTRRRTYPGFVWSAWDNIGGAVTTVERCPASIDASNPAYNVPEGMPKGPDGKCPTARYNHQPMTADQAKSKFMAYPPADPGSALKDPLREAVDAGKQQVPAEIEVSGPQSQTGAPTSTTTTNGQGTTTTTQQQVYNYHYEGARITYDTTTITNTCTGAGSCTSETATTSTTTTEAPPTEQDPKDPCTANPTRAGCAKLGQPGEAEVPREQKPFVVAPVQLSSGACPASVQWQAFGAAHEFAFTPMCDAASTWVRGVVLVIGAALAAFVFVGGLKS